jgi:hypothetical protein
MPECASEAQINQYYRDLEVSMWQIAKEFDANMFY